MRVMRGAGWRLLLIGVSWYVLLTAHSPATYIAAALLAACVLLT